MDDFSILKDYDLFESFNASSPESVGDLRGRQLPKCMQECDFCHIVRLESAGFFHRQFRLAIHALHTTC